MSSNWIESIPEHLRDTAREAISSTFGSAPVVSIEPILEGASGALAYRIEMGGRPYVLRIETRRSPLRNPHQYACMRIAADAEVAPPLRYVDENSGVAIMDLIVQRPLHEYPGGPTGLAAAIGDLAAKLQATPQFPVLGDYRVILERLLTRMRTLFVAGLLDPYVEAFGRIREVYPWDASTHVSSHNDPNPRNILFDGNRLWLIDWETAYRNDSLTDIAILTENFAPTPELETVLLQSWLGRIPDRDLRSRLLLMRQLTRLYYAGLLFVSSVKAPSSVTSLDAPSPAEFRSQVATGQLKIAASETKVVLAKMILKAFRIDISRASFRDALATFNSG